MHICSLNRSLDDGYYIPFLFVLTNISYEYISLGSGISFISTSILKVSAVLVHVVLGLDEK